MTIERLASYTYEVRHNPNCPAPFLIITCGNGGRIGRPGNFISYGKTLDAAAADAVQQIERHEKLKRERSDDCQRDFRIAHAQWAVRGVVWA